MKKLISALLALAMAFTFATGISVSEAVPDIAVSAYAEESTPLEKQMLPYHYSKLSDTYKTVYIELRKAVLNHQRTFKYNKALDKDSVINITDIIFYEDPLAFNLKRLSYSIGSRTTEFELGFSFDQESVEKMLSKMNKVADKVISKFDEDTTTYNKILYIHDYIIGHTVYDDSLNSSRSAYGSMVVGKSVCEGYARAFGYICAKAGIKTVNVVGIGTNEQGSENHMWNKVYYNKKWYDIDLTWDDPTSIYKENKTYKYFMTGSQAFSRSHNPCNTSLVYPESTDDTSMNYYTRKKLVADDKDSAYNLLVSQIAKAAKKKCSSVTIKLADKEAFDEFKSFMDKNNCRNVFKVLSAAKKKTSTVITDRYYNYYADPNTLTVNVCFMIKNTTLSDYFTDVSKAPQDVVDFFKDAGITNKTSKKAA